MSQSCLFEQQFPPGLLLLAALPVLDLLVYSAELRSACLQRIAEHDYLKAEEVEGANDFLRATRQEHETLRRRGPGRQLSAASPSGLGKSSEAV